MKEKAFAVVIMTLFLMSMSFVTLVQSRPKVYDWIDKSPTTAPAARSDVEMVYDSANEVVVLFGGGGYWIQRWNWFGDTWIYSIETNTWTNMNPTVSPSPRHGIAMAYDSSNKKVVMYGDDATWTYTETWTYDVSTNTWTNMNPATSPPEAAPSSLEYDSVNKVMVHLRYLDVWTYSLDTNTWIKREPATQPPNRWNGPEALAYDSGNNRMILFGGLWWVDSIALPRDDTWAYDVKKNTWTDITPSVSPRGSIAHGITYDSKNKVVVMFGGDTGWYGPAAGDTWTYMQEKLVKEIKPPK